MGNYKVCVYAICRNEEKFVRRWMHSMSEADEVVVLDTGSTDATVQLLEELGARVTVEEISPWRFDVARNRSLELVAEDADICVCTDLDEVFHPGWRSALERAWGEGAHRLSYRYTWSFRPDGGEGSVFCIEKIHSRRGWRWTHPVHEVLEWTGEGVAPVARFAPGVQLDHHPDPEKSRAQYLPLLELSVQEAPEDDRNMHYLGREYLFRRRWDDCIRTLNRHLSMPTARWADERAASMRYIARAYLQKGEWERAVAWYLRAVAEAPHLREGYVELAHLLYEKGEWDGVVWLTGRALAITKRPDSYISEAAAWGSLVWDLRAMALYHTGRIPQALEAARQAAQMEPGEKRLAENVRVIEAMLAAQGEMKPHAR
ncbi:MAG: glycosyltransferase [Oscillospiraceae bacterium]|nr:glycosyltransferase [Oscillospiraceae bacterium]